MPHFWLVKKWRQKKTSFSSVLRAHFSPDKMFSNLKTANQSIYKAAEQEKIYKWFNFYVMYMRIIMWMNFTQLNDLHIKQTLVFHFFQQLAKFLNMLSTWKMMTYHCPTWRTQKQLLCLLQNLSYWILFTHCCHTKKKSSRCIIKENFSISQYLPNFLFLKTRALLNLRHSLQNETGLHSFKLLLFLWKANNLHVYIHEMYSHTAGTWKCWTLPPLEVQGRWQNYHTVI